MFQLSYSQDVSYDTIDPQSYQQPAGTYSVLGIVLDPRDEQDLFISITTKRRGYLIAQLYAMGDW